MKSLTGAIGRDLVITSNCLKADGTPFPLAGGTLWWTLKTTLDTAPNDLAAVARLTWVSGGAATGIAVASPTTGVATITLAAAQTALLDPTLIYRYDLVALDATGAYSLLEQGIVTFARRVTTVP